MVHKHFKVERRLLCLSFVLTARVFLLFDDSYCCPEISHACFQNTFGRNTPTISIVFLLNMLEGIFVNVNVNLHIFLVTGEECPIPMDATIIIDSSECVSRRNWVHLLNFVQTLVSFFNVSPAGSRIALIQYSTDANVVLKFNTLTGNLLNGAEVTRQIGRLQCLRGSRRTDKGLELADKEVLTPAAGLRNITKVRALTAVRDFTPC